MQSGQRGTMRYGHIVKSEKQLEHQLQGRPEVEVSDSLHRYPLVVVGTAFHSRHEVVALTANTIEFNFRLDVHSGSLEVVDVIVQKAVYGEFHNPAFHFPHRTGLKNRRILRCQVDGSLILSLT